MTGAQRVEVSCFDKVKQMAMTGFILGGSVGVVLGSYGAFRYIRTHAQFKII